MFRFGPRIETIRGLARIAASKCNAALVCTLALSLLACRLPTPRPFLAATPAVHVLPVPDAPGERSCAWFGDVRDGVLYFGISAFWSALRAEGGSPVADLASAGPRWIGRFDLARESFLPPLVAGPATSASGVWDVLAHPNGRVYFTTYFDFAGSVDPRTGALAEFAGAGQGLNELAPGPDGTVLATRYGYGTSPDGSVVVLSQDGEVLSEHPLADPPGYRASAKSVAFDPLRREIWVNTDLFPAAGPGAVRHDARVLRADGTELRIDGPELEFFTFAPDGTGWFAEQADGRLRLRVRPPAGATARERSITLDDAFHAGSDFAQDVRAEPDGRVVVTRWSGRVYVVAPGGRVEDVVLPQRAGDIYYTATLAGSRVCATRCGWVEVVCADLPTS